MPFPAVEKRSVVQVPALLAVLPALVMAQKALALTVQPIGRKAQVQLDSAHSVKHDLLGGKAIKAVYQEADKLYAIYYECFVSLHRQFSVQRSQRGDPESAGVWQFHRV